MLMKRDAWAYLKTEIFNDKERVNILIKRNGVSKNRLMTALKKEAQVVLIRKMILNLYKKWENIRCYLLLFSLVLCMDKF